MSYYITEVLESITFNNRNIAIVDPANLVESDRFVTADTDNKTYCGCDTMVGDWEYSGYDISLNDLIRNPTNHDPIKTIEQSSYGDGMIAVIDRDQFTFENESSSINFDNWSGTVYFVVIENDAGESMVAINGVPKNRQCHRFCLIGNQWC